MLLVFAASRLFYLAAGVAFVELERTPPFQSVVSQAPLGAINLWAQWDGRFYTGLAANGYLEPPGNVSPAFFPLYPLLMRSVASFFGGPISAGALSTWGVLISLAALPFAFYFLYRLAEHGWGTRAAEGTVLCLAFFPTAFFFNAVYTESLFLMLSTGAVWAMRVRKDLLLACLLAALATATRNVGIFLLIPLGYEWMRGIREYGWWGGAYLGLAPSGLIAYMGYLWLRFGEPLLFYTDQQKWGRQPAGFLGTIEGAWSSAVSEFEWLFDPQSRAELSLGQLVDHLGYAGNTYNLLFFLLAAALLVVGLRTLPPGLSLYALFIAFVPIFFGNPDMPLMGFPRFVLVAFPLFIVLGVLLNNRRVLAGWLAFSTVASLLFCAVFVSSRFLA